VRFPLSAKLFNRGEGLMKDFRKLEVWEKSHALVLDVSNSTSQFPQEELYGLTSQMWRAALSIPANSAEGCGRGSDSDFARYVQIAMGSASELEYELLVSRDLGFLDASIQAKLDKQVQSAKQMLAARLQTLHHPTGSIRDESASYTASGADGGPRSADSVKESEWQK
jgi:four helix bundle protein